MGLRIRKRVCANTKEELRKKVDVYIKDGWNEGRTIQTIDNTTSLECHLWKDLDENHREQVIQERQQYIKHLQKEQDEKYR